MHRLSTMSLVSSLTALVLAVVCLAQTLPVFEVTTSGSTVEAYGFEVYQDAACTAPLTHIDWGNISQGQTKQHTFYIKNTGTQPINTTLTTDYWNPANATAYLSVVWNREHHTLPAATVADATVFLIAADTTLPIVDFTFSLILGVTP